jgi:hypothetical protein
MIKTSIAIGQATKNTSNFAIQNAAQSLRERNKIWEATRKLVRCSGNLFNLKYQGTASPPARLVRRTRFDPSVHPIPIDLDEKKRYKGIRSFQDT